MTARERSDIFHLAAVTFLVTFLVAFVTRLAVGLVPFALLVATVVDVIRIVLDVTL